MISATIVVAAGTLMGWWLRRVFWLLTLSPEEAQRRIESDLLTVYLRAHFQRP